jgi:hypothetical protein
MSSFIKALLNFAHAVAPHKDRLWLEDMRYEAAFIPNKFSWGLSALGLALRWRLAQMFSHGPSRLAFTSVAVAAVATLLIVPNLNPKTKTTPASVAVPSPSIIAPEQTAAESETASSSYAEDASISRSAEAQTLPEENTAATDTDLALSQAQPPMLPNVSAPITDAEAVSGPIPPTVPTPQTQSSVEQDILAQASLDQITEPQNQATEPSNADDESILLGALPSPTTPAEASTNQQVDAEAATSSGLVELPASPEAAVPIDQNDIEAVIEGAIKQEEKKDETTLETLELASSSVSLKIIKEVTLEIRQGINASDKLLFSGMTQAGQTLVYTLPIYVQASDGTALEVYADEELRGNLGDGETIKVIQAAQ